MENKSLTNLLLIGLVAFFVYQSLNKQQGGNQANPVNPPAVVVTPASAEAKAAVAALAGHPKQAGMLSAFYRDFSNVLANSDTVKTVGQFQSAHVNGLKVLLATGAGEPGAPAVGAGIDSILARATGGLNDTTVDAAKKIALVSAMRDISTALGEIK